MIITFKVNFKLLNQKKYPIRNRVVYNQIKKFTIDCLYNIGIK